MTQDYIDAFMKVWTSKVKSSPNGSRRVRVDKPHIHMLNGRYIVTLVIFRGKGSTTNHRMACKYALQMNRQRGII